MIDEFKIPPNDKIVECLLASPEKNWNAGLFISTGQAEGFYSDEFHFWVRAFYCFVEDTARGALFSDAARYVSCKEVPVDNFRNEYIRLFKSGTPADSFLEAQSFPQSRIEFIHRSFERAYSVLDCPHIKSALALSEGEYVAYFNYNPKGNN